MTTDDILKILAGVFATSFIAFLGNVFGIIRFGKTDTAKIQQIHIENEVALSKQALEWTINLKARLDKADEQIDAIREECEILRQENKTSDAQITSLEQQKKMLEAHIVSLEQHCTTLKEENAQLKKENEDYKIKLETFINKYDSSTDRTYE